MIITTADYRIRLSDTTDRITITKQGETYAIWVEGSDALDFLRVLRQFEHTEHLNAAVEGFYKRCEKKLGMPPEDLAPAEYWIRS